MTGDIFIDVLLLIMIVPLAVMSFLGTIFFSVWICKEIKKLIRGGR